MGKRVCEKESERKHAGAVFVHSFVGWQNVGNFLGSAPPYVSQKLMSLLLDQWRVSAVGIQ